MNDSKKRKLIQIESFAFTLYLSAKEIRKEFEAEILQKSKNRGKLLLIKGGKKD